MSKVQFAVIHVYGQAMSLNCVLVSTAEALEIEINCISALSGGGAVIESICRQASASCAAILREKEPENGLQPQEMPREAFQVKEITDVVA